MTEENLTCEQARERVATADRLAAATARRAAPIAAITSAGIGALVALA